MSSGSIAESSVSLAQSATSQKIANSVLKQQAQSEQALAQMIEQVAKSAPAGPGLGQNVDRRV
jgi:hypothetical protein